MSQTIDNKVVEMSFDNSKFEKNVQTSISSLDQLKKSLDFDGIANGLDDVDSSTQNCSSNISGLSAGIETVGQKFSALQVIAITALANITNSAVEAGKRLVASLSVDQISAGFAKYEEKTQSVQTIINATGKTIDEVNEQLEKLNWFTDETSYNFTDMVSSIGKFTSNGIDLETSVTAMMGIANWAALSGQNADSASRAMYNLSQAIGIGAVKLQDWKSIENANMATKEFKEIAVQTAIALGKLDEKATTANGTVITSANFSSTLAEGWFTSDVLLAALEKYGNYTEEVYKVATEEGLTAADAMKIVSSETMELGAKAFKAAQEAKTFSDALNATKDAVSSGWSNTFETIFGNYEEAKVLWTDVANELYDIFAASAEGRNELLAEWADLGGRDYLIEAFMNTLQILKDVIDGVKESFHDIFPPVTAENLVSISESVRDFTERLKNNEGLLNNVKKVFRGLFAVLDIGKQIISAVINAIKGIKQQISTITGGVINLTGSFGDFLVKLDETIKETDIFNKVFTGITGVIVNVIAFLTKLFKKVRESKVFGEVSLYLKNAFEKLKTFLNAAKERFSTPGFEAFHILLEKLHILLGKIWGGISKVISAVANAIKNMFGAVSGSSLIDTLTKVWDIVISIGRSIFGILGKAINWLIDRIQEGDFSNILETLKTIASGGIAVGILQLINSIKEPFEGIGEILDGVRGCLEAYQTKIRAESLLKIAIAIGILVASIAVLSTIKQEELVDGIAAIGFVLGEMLIAMGIMNKMAGGGKKLRSFAAIMLGMSVAVFIMASALKKLSSLESDELTRGLVGITALVAMVVAATKIIGKDSKKVMKGAFQFILLAMAIKILASACIKMAKLSWSDMAKGLVGVGILLAEVAAFLKLARFQKKAVSTAIGIVFLATAIKILASACKTFSTMSWEGMAKGLVGIAALLAEIVIFSKFMGKAKKMISIGIGLIAIAAAMKIFSSAIGSFSNLSWEGVAKGLVAMAGCLTAVTIAINFMPKGMIAKGLGLIAIAAALTILSSALIKMGDMSWSSVAKGLVALGGSMAILAVGLRALKKTISGAAALLVAVSAIAILAPALALLGAMSWEGILKSLVVLAGTFVILGVAGLVLKPLVPTILALAGALALVGIAVLTAGVGLSAIAVAISALSISFTAFATAFAAGATAITAGLAIIIEGLAKLIPTVSIMLATGLIEFAKIIGENAPVIFDAVKSIILNLLSTLSECVPQIVEVIFTLLESVLLTIVDHAPIIVQAVFDILVACLKGIADNIQMVVETAVDIVVNFIKGITQKLPDVIQAGFDLLIGFIDGIANAIENNAGRVMEAAKHLIMSILNAMIEILKNGVSSFIDIGKNIMEGLWNGIKNAATKVVDGVKDIGQQIADGFCNFFGINSPSKLFTDYGMYIDQGLANGLKKYSNLVESATEDVGDSTISIMSEAIEEAYDIIQSDDYSEPTIRPVLDLSEIQNGANKLQRMMKNADDYKMATSIDLADKASRSMNGQLDDKEVSALDGLSKSIKKMADNPSQTITLTFNVSGDNPHEIAEEVSRIIQNQISRKGAVWE